MIFPGGEPFWSGSGPTGIVCLHGFTSAPQELHWLGEQLAGSGCTVHVPRLPGHCTSPSDLNRTDWQDWMAALDDSFHLLSGRCERIYAVGLSMGGMLALTAAGNGLPLAGVAAISTPFQIPTYPGLGWLGVLLPGLGKLSWLVPALPKPPPLDYHDRRAAQEHLGYRVLPTRGLAQVARLAAEMRSTLQQIEIPVLLIHSRQDRGVHPSNAVRLLEEIGTRKKELFWVKHSGHVIPCEPERERARDAIINFISMTSGR